MSNLPSYPKVLALGHPGLAELFEDDTVVEEKLDGSQFSFGIIDGAIEMRSKGATVYVNDNNKMFELAIKRVGEIASLLTPGWIYRCEYLNRPKHNTLAYERAPLGNLVLFDVETGPQTFLGPAEKYATAISSGIEPVATLAQFEAGGAPKLEYIEELLETDSQLGGQKIEGIVVKNYSRFGRDGKVLVGKYVSERFKEVHNSDWKKRNPSRTDLVDQLAQKYRSEARWDKAIYRLRDAGELENSPRDIGKLIHAIQEDVKEECADAIKEALFKWAWGKIGRASAAGFPEFYKQKLLASQFSEDEANYFVASAGFDEGETAAIVEASADAS